MAMARETTLNGAPQGAWISGGKPAVWHAPAMPMIGRRPSALADMPEILPRAEQELVFFLDVLTKCIILSNTFPYGSDGSSDQSAGIGSRQQVEILLNGGSCCQIVTRFVGIWLISWSIRGIYGARFRSRHLVQSKTRSRITRHWVLQQTL